MKGVEHVEGSGESTGVVYLRLHIFLHCVILGLKLENFMGRKKFMAIHTYHSDEMKKAFWKGNHKSTNTELTGETVTSLTSANVLQLGLVPMTFSFVSGKQKIHKMY